MEENDLPLLSNISHWRGRHYLIQLSPDFCSETIIGQLIIFFDRPTLCEMKGEYCTQECLRKPELHSTPIDSDLRILDPDIILDCCDIDIHTVFEVKNSFETLPLALSEFKCLSYWIQQPKETLKFTVDKWSLKISTSSASRQICRAILINYQTRKCGKSVYWRKDADNILCLFTPGASINNRSLLPCQDQPLAMATWQAWIIVSSHLYVAMTGDENPVITHHPACKDTATANCSTPVSLNCFYYFTTMVLPLSTIAIAIGKWKVNKILCEDQFETSKWCHTTSTSSNAVCHHSVYPCYLDREDAGPFIPLTFVVPESFSVIASHLYEFAKYCLRACYFILGRHPLKRLEVVILPRCFAHLGLASPNLILLSKTLLSNDASSHIRLAHEISHTWFGITIGAKDWREEWISEGFATFLEDPIYAVALELLEAERNYEVNINSVLAKYENFFELRAHIRYGNLKSEIENTEEELQILSPAANVSKYNSSSNSDSSLGHAECTDSKSGSIANGINAVKPFLQVHYLKGYFLLRYLCHLVSYPLFLDFLRNLFLYFHGQLISSHDILDLYFKTFPETEQKISKNDIFSNWLSTNSIDSDFVKKYASASDDNDLIICIHQHLKCWDDVMVNCEEKMLIREMKRSLLTNHKIQYSDQLVLLFERLLEKKNIDHSVLEQIAAFYNLKNRNADVRHRWCELLIKHNYSDLSAIENFLTEDQSMGLYLYGELMISNRKKCKNLARHMFLTLQNELDSNAKQVVRTMIYGD